MKTRNLTAEQAEAHERQQARLAERAAHAGDFTVAQAARLVSVTPNAVEQAIHHGRLQATKIAYPAPWGSWRIGIEALRACWPDLERIKLGAPRGKRNGDTTAITQDEAPHLFDPDVIIPRLHPEARAEAIKRNTTR